MGGKRSCRREGAVRPPRPRGTPHIVKLHMKKYLLELPGNAKVIRVDGIVVGQYICFSWSSGGFTVAVIF